MVSRRSDSVVTAAWSSLWDPRVEAVQFYDTTSLYAAAPSFLTAAVELRAPSPIAAPWLGAVQRRLERSIASPDDPDDPTTISESIAAAAISFFEATSDVLPGEPYLYPSSQGDLIAEFKGSFGRLTSILGHEFLIVHAVVNDATIQQELPLGDEYEGIRGNLRDISVKLNSMDHGKALDSNSK